MHPRVNDVLIRAGRPADEDRLRRLAALDSRRPLRGAALVAEVDGHMVAAVSLADGTVVADPFERTAEAVELLRVRAQRAQRPAAAPPRRWTWRLRARAQTG